MCEINPQIHCVVENLNGTFRLERFNNVTKQYETLNTNLTKIDAYRIKEELDADLRGK